MSNFYKFLHLTHEGLWLIFHLTRPLKKKNIGLVVCPIQRPTLPRAKIQLKNGRDKDWTLHQLSIKSLIPLVGIGTAQMPQRFVPMDLAIFHVSSNLLQLLTKPSHVFHHLISLIIVGLGHLLIQPFLEYLFQPKPNQWLWYCVKNQLP